MAGENVDDERIPIDTSDERQQEGDDSILPSRDASTEQGLTPGEEAALGRVRMLSQLLDEAFRVPGTNYRVGLDPILGILPGAGDAVAAAISLYPIIEAYRFGASKLTLARMLALVGIDMVVGSIPLIGPVFDAVWKANKWNLASLERHIQEE